jgi:hypothetical protein
MKDQEKRKQRKKRRGVAGTEEEEAPRQNPWQTLVIHSQPQISNEVHRTQIIVREPVSTFVEPFKPFSMLLGSLPRSLWKCISSYVSHMTPGLRLFPVLEPFSHGGFLLFFCSFVCRSQSSELTWLQFGCSGLTQSEAHLFNSSCEEKCD